MSREENMMVGFTIVAIAGDARREVMAAMEKDKNGLFDEARSHMLRHMTRFLRKMVYPTLHTQHQLFLQMLLFVR
ncbi:hypothetical protein [Mammaliicoccus sciuri]|uniref:hypothetical protein n=1 Tax=Mammaliicoccus sciuri TaxID=1296 RepID=UPI003F571550